MSIKQDYIEVENIYNKDGEQTINLTGDQGITVPGVTTIGTGTTGSPYDATTFLHIKGTTRSVVQQSSTADAYYMFGDAGANNVAWVGYSHSAGTLDLHAETAISLDKNTSVTGTFNAKGAIEVKDSDGNTTLSHGRLNSNGNEGFLTVSNGSNWGLVARGPGNDPRIGAWYGGVLKIEGMHSSDGQPGSNSIDFAQFHFGNNHFQMNAATSAFVGHVELQNSQLKIRDTSNNAQIMIQGSVGGYARIMAHDTNTGNDQGLKVVAEDVNFLTGSISGSSNASALLLDSSKNATFAGNVTLNSRLTFDHGGDHYLEAGTNTLAFKNSSGTSSLLIGFGDQSATFGGVLVIPSYIYHASDPSGDTYFGFNGNDNFTVVTAGGNGLVIDSNRNATFTGDLNLSKSSGSFIYLNTNTGAADTGLFLTEGSTANKTQNGFKIYYSGSANTLNFDSGTTSLTNKLSIARDTGNATFKAMSVFQTSLTNNDDWENSPVSIRERGLIGTGSADDKYSPNLNFHWGGRQSNSLWMDSVGDLHYGEYSAAGVPTQDGTFKVANVILSSALTIPDYIHHDGDAGTKFGFSANDTFVVRTGGSVRLTVNDTESSVTGNFCAGDGFTDKAVAYGNLGLGSKSNPKVAYPGYNAQWSHSGNSTGQIVIDLPGTLANYDMMYMEIDIYEYSSNNATKLIIGGHNWNSGGNGNTSSTMWHNTGVTILGSFEKSIYFGWRNDGTNNRRVIAIGEVDSAWSYSTVHVSKVSGAANFYSTAIDWLGDWEVAQTTSTSYFTKSPTTNFNTTTANTLKTPGVINPVGGFVFDGNTISGINDSDEFTNDDSHIMTSAAIEDKILSYGYGTGSGSSNGDMLLGTAQEITADKEYQDGIKAKFGNDADLQIYHDGTNAHIANSTGDLNFNTSTGHMYIYNSTDDKDIVFQTDNGSGANSTFFYLDGSLTNGSTVLGATRFPDKSKIYMGTGGDLEIFHDGTNTYIENYNGNFDISQLLDGGDLRFRCDNGTGGTDTYITLDGSDGIVRVHKPLWINDYITHIGDTNTFFGFSAADTFVVHAGASGHAELTIGSSGATFDGYVGIGVTASTNAMLDVKGPDTDNAVLGRFYSNTGARGSFIIKNGSGTSPTTFIGTAGGSEQLSIGTNSIEAIRLDASQNATFAGDIKIQKNSPLLEIGTLNTSTGNAKIQFYSKNTGANGFAILYNKNGSGAGEDQLEFIDGSGSANFKFINGGAVNFTGNITTGGHIYLPGSKYIYSNNKGLIGATASQTEIYGISNIISFYAEGGGTKYMTISGGDVAIGTSNPTSLSANTSSLSIDSTRTDLTGAIFLKANGATQSSIYWDSAGLSFNSLTSDKDIYFKGNDGGSTITALTLDMSSAGTATFNHELYIPNHIYHVGDGNTYFGFSASDEWLVVAGGTNKFAADANAAYMYYQGNVKFQTTSAGVEVAGEIRTTEYIVHKGDSNTLMGFPGADRVILHAGGNSNVELVNNSVAIRYNGGTKLATVSAGVKTSYAATSSTDGDAAGDIVYFSETSTTAGRIYYYTSAGAWELADADAQSSASGMLAVALGSSSSTHGMLLRGMVTLNHDPGAVGDTLFLSTAIGAAQSTAPSGAGDIVRVIGYCLHASNGQIYFNPDGAFVEVTAG